LQDRSVAGISLIKDTYYTVQDVFTEILLDCWV
jgi:hypothetical protein